MWEWTYTQMESVQHKRFKVTRRAARSAARRPSRDKGTPGRMFQRGRRVFCFFFMFLCSKIRKLPTIKWQGLGKLEQISSAVRRRGFPSPRWWKRFYFCEMYAPTAPANLESQQYWLNRRILSNPSPFPLKAKIILDICQQLTYLGISSLSI